MAQLCTDFAPLSNLLSLLTLGSYKIFIPKQRQQPQPPQRTGQRAQGTVVGEATGACIIWATLPQKLV
jgi:hypothetical protein